jgi:hypothetical protein
MPEYQTENAYTLKVDQPKWQPSKSKYLDTVFVEHMRIVDGMCNVPDVSGDTMEGWVRGLLSLISPEAKRDEIVSDVMERYKRYCGERAELRNIEDINQLDSKDQSHCWKLAWLDMLGKIMDVQSKVYHTEGNEQCIGVFGMRGFDKDGEPAILMSSDKLMELLGSMSKEVKVGGEHNGS